MLQVVERFIAKHQLLKPGDHLLVGVSGGADSVALLLCLVELAPAMSVTLTAAHVNHGLRGEAAAEDARFVAELCRDLAVPCVTSSIDVRAFRPHLSSLQEAAREARFRFFAKVCQEQGQNKVALGHHQDDRVETVLLNLTRGAGLNGLVGMRPVNRGLFGLTIIRPLLGVNRAAIEAYLCERKQMHKDDLSNLDTKYSRNLVRHEVLPVLRKLNSDAANALLRVADHAAHDDDYITREAQSLWLVIHDPLSLGNALRLDPLLSVHSAIAMRLFRWAYAKEHGCERNLESVHMEGCLRLLGQQAGRRQHLPGGITVLRTRHHLVFYRSGQSPQEPYERELPIPGRIVLPCGSTLSVEVATEVPAHFPPPSAPLAFVSGIKNILKVRNRRPGDTYIPLGASGHKKLKEAMSEAQIPLPWRGTLPVVEAEGAVVWVPGLRVAEQFRVPSPKLDRTFKLTYRHGGKDNCLN